MGTYRQPAIVVRRDFSNAILEKFIGGYRNAQKNKERKKKEYQYALNDVENGLFDERKLSAQTSWTGNKNLDDQIIPILTSEFEKLHKLAVASIGGDQTEFRDANARFNVLVEEIGSFVGSATEYSKTFANRANKGFYETEEYEYTDPKDDTKTITQSKVKEGQNPVYGQISNRMFNNKNSGKYNFWANWRSNDGKIHISYDTPENGINFAVVDDDGDPNTNLSYSINSASWRDHLTNKGVPLHTLPDYEGVGGVKEMIDLSWDKVGGDDSYNEIIKQIFDKDNNIIRVKRDYEIANKERREAIQNNTGLDELFLDAAWFELYTGYDPTPFLEQGSNTKISKDLMNELKDGGLDILKEFKKNFTDDVMLKKGKESHYEKEINQMDEVVQINRSIEDKVFANVDKYYATTMVNNVEELTMKPTERNKGLVQNLNELMIRTDQKNFAKWKIKGNKLFYGKNTYDGSTGKWSYIYDELTWLDLDNKDAVAKFLLRQTFQDAKAQREAIYNYENR